MHTVKHSLYEVSLTYYNRCYSELAYGFDCMVGCALFDKPIWQLTVNERGHYADSEDTFLFKIEDSPDTRLGA